MGHRDVKATSCPGSKFYNDYVTKMTNYVSVLDLGATSGSHDFLSSPQNKDRATDTITYYMVSRCGLHVPVVTSPKKQQLLFRVIYP